MSDSTPAPPDRVEHEVDIDASAEDVFRLVCRPGWWINDGDVDPEPRLHYEDDVAVVIHDQWGTFKFRPVASDRPRSVSYRWLDRVHTSVGTLVEFEITDRADGGVTLSVQESGFTTLGNTDAQVTQHVKENTAGWTTELDAARRFVTAPEPGSDPEAG